MPCRCRADALLWVCRSARRFLKKEEKLISTFLLFFKKSPCRPADPWTRICTASARHLHGPEPRNSNIETANFPSKLMIFLHKMKENHQFGRELRFKIKRYRRLFAKFFRFAVAKKYPMLTVLSKKKYCLFIRKKNVDSSLIKKMLAVQKLLAVH